MPEEYGSAINMQGKEKRTATCTLHCTCEKLEMDDGVAVAVVVAMVSQSVIVMQFNLSPHQKSEM